MSSVFHRRASWLLVLLTVVGLFSGCTVYTGVTPPTSVVDKGLTVYVTVYDPLLLLFAAFVDSFTGGTLHTGVTPPTSVVNKGLVAYVTVDDPSLRVGQTTTGRLWVEQTSPSADNDNGVFAVAANIEASPPAIIESCVPASLLAPWNASLSPAMTGTAIVSGGISGIAASQGTIPPDKDLGIGAPIQVATFQITAKAAGTVTLIPTNYDGDGYMGIMPVDTSDDGDEANYVPVQITVQ